VGFDEGNEIKLSFEEMGENCGMTAMLINLYNPHANRIVKRIHQVVNDMLKTFELEEQQLDPKEPWSGILHAMAFGAEREANTTLPWRPHMDNYFWIMTSCYQIGLTSK